MCGIYIILNKVSQKAYVGYSNNVKARLSSHRSNMSKGIHFIKELQEDVEKYGLENFEFAILEYCELDDLATRESYWADLLNVFDAEMGYNKRPMLSGSTVIKKGYDYKLIDGYALINRKTNA